MISYGGIRFIVHVYILVVERKVITVNICI